MTTETMREAVARAMDAALRAMESDARVSELTDDEVRAIADAAIRTVLERLREPGDAVIEAGYDILMERGCNPLSEDAQDVWQAMLDASCAGGGVNAGQAETVGEGAGH